MIPRYSRAEMATIWETENKLRIWFEIEAHACDAMAKLGIIPAKAAQKYLEKRQMGRWRASTRSRK